MADVYLLMVLLQDFMRFRKSTTGDTNPDFCPTVHTNHSITLSYVIERTDNMTILNVIIVKKIYIILRPQCAIYVILALRSHLEVLPCAEFLAGGTAVVSQAV